MESPDCKHFGHLDRVVLNESIEPEQLHRLGYGSSIGPEANAQRRATRLTAIRLATDEDWHAHREATGGCLAGCRVFALQIRRTRRPVGYLFEGNVLMKD